MRIILPSSSIISKGLSPAHMSFGQYRLVPILNFCVLRTCMFVLSDPQIALIVVTWYIAILVHGQCANLLQVKHVAKGDVQ